MFRIMQLGEIEKDKHETREKKHETHGKNCALTSYALVIQPWHHKDNLLLDVSNFQ